MCRDEEDRDYDMDAAAKSGCLDTLRLMEKETGVRVYVGSDEAGSTTQPPGHCAMDCENDDDSARVCEGMTDALCAASQAGHAEVVKFLLEHRVGGVSIVSAMDSAVAGGHLDLVELFHAIDNGGCTTQAMEGVATGGHLEIVQWLSDNRSEGCTAAAMDGAPQQIHKFP
jgi:hypothetical protein